MHVEVKGTRTLGEKVTLTANEVEHTWHAAHCGAEHMLYVLSQIAVHDKGAITVLRRHARRGSGPGRSATTT